jgi:hypothetical protein
MRDFRSDLDQNLDEPFQRTFDLFAHEAELPERLQEIAKITYHEQKF